MKAVVYQNSLPINDPNALLDAELPKPTPGLRDLLVKIEAVSVNPVDTKIRNRVDPQGESKVLGWDASGTVEQVGNDVTLFQPGDKVFYAGAIDRPGTNSEFHLVDERLVGKMPTSLSFVEAAALPLTTITAWEMLFDRMLIVAHSKGKILIIGAAGGVGSIMIQMVKQLTDLSVVATASRPETIEWVKSLGADHVINHRNPLNEELDAADLGQVQFVASLTNTGDHLPAIAEAIAPQGKICVIDDPEGGLDIMPFKQKSVSFHWEFMFTRSLFDTEDLVKQHLLLNRVSELVDEGKIRTTLASCDGRICAADLKNAHALIESGKAKGKIVLAGF